MIGVLSAGAENDLEYIGDYIAQDNPLRSTMVVADLPEQCLSLSDMPLRFAIVPRLKRRSIRRRFHKGYGIYYRLENQRVEIVRILHGSQDYEAAMQLDSL